MKGSILQKIIHKLTQHYQLMKSPDESYEEAPIFKQKRRYHTNFKNRLSQQFQPPQKQNHSSNAQNLLVSPIHNPKFQNFLVSKNRPTFSEFQKSCSLKESFHLVHINSVHKIISKIRDRKSDIEDLLRAQEAKAQSEEYDEMELGHSMRKLKKVQRLLQVICKLINLKFDDPSQIGLSRQQELSLQESYEQNIAHFEKQLQKKNKQIERLISLVNILDSPKKEESFVNNPTEIIYINQGFSISDNKETDNQCTQTYQTKMFSSNYFSSSRIQEVEEEASTENPKVFEITNVFSVWNINDRHKEKEKKELKMVKCQNVTIDSPIKHPFLKRFKSVFKIALNSLNMCTNMMIRKTSGRQDLMEVSNKIQQIAESFNTNYHITKEKYSDELYKQFKNELSDLSQRVENLTKKVSL